MNIYEKLQVMRCELQGMSLKKSGKNKFAGYEYFELQDFIPAINNLMLKHKVVSGIQYEKEMASLVFYNTEKPDERILFTSPMAEATLKGCHAVQNLGAAETYIRRYLYITAFEIVEHDGLDVGVEKEQEPKETPAQQKRATDMAESFKLCTELTQLEEVGKEYRSEISKFPAKLKEWIRQEYLTMESRIKGDITNVEKEEK